MVREIVYAGFMDTTWLASAFLLAFQVPNLFRRLLGEGAQTAAFIPIFKKDEKRAGDPAMWLSPPVSFELRVATYHISWHGLG